MDKVNETKCLGVIIDYQLKGLAQANIIKNGDFILAYQYDHMM